MLAGNPYIYNFINVSHSDVCQRNAPEYSEPDYLMVAVNDPAVRGRAARWFRREPHFTKVALAKIKCLRKFFGLFSKCLQKFVPLI
jgi:hypothetical protein